MRSTILLLLSLVLTRCTQPARDPPPRSAGTPSAHVGRNAAFSPGQWMRCAHGVAALGTKLYVVGGITNTGDHACIGRVDCYDTVARQWTTVAPCPAPRAFPGVAALGGRLHVVGGLSDKDVNDLRYTAVHQCYDPTTDTWKTLAAPSVRRSRMTMVAANGRLYAIGGLGLSDDSAAVEIYDPKTDAWEAGPDMPTPRHALCAAVVGERIFVLGGYHVKLTLDELDCCEILDTKAGKWSSGPAMTAKRAWFGAAVVDDCIIAIGGSGRPEKLREPWQAWSSIDIADVNDRRFAVVAVGQELFVFGGEMGGPAMRVLDVKAGKWESTQP